MRMLRIWGLAVDVVVLRREARSLRSALVGDDSEVRVALSRETAEFVARVVEARADGREVIVTHGAEEVTPAQAALMMGRSRPQVRKLMDLGMLPYRMVGSHHRIPMAAIREYMEAEPARRRAALEHYAQVQNELGLFE
jgi:excisionase family DNA binding protein